MRAASPVRSSRSSHRCPLEKRNFRRFLGPDVPWNAVVKIDLPAPPKQTDIDPRFMVALTVLIGGAMVFALARALRRR